MGECNLKSEREVESRVDLGSKQRESQVSLLHVRYDMPNICTRKTGHVSVAANVMVMSSPVVIPDYSGELSE